MGHNENRAPGPDNCPIMYILSGLPGESRGSGSAASDEGANGQRAESAVGLGKRGNPHARRVCDEGAAAGRFEGARAEGAARALCERAGLGVEAAPSGSLTCPSCRGSGARVEIGDRARVVSCEDCEGTGCAPGLIDCYTSEEIAREALVACAQADAARLVAEQFRLHRETASGPLLLDALQRARTAFERASKLASASLGLDLTPPEMPVESRGDL